MDSEKAALLEYLQKLPKDDNVTLCCEDGEYNMTVKAAISGLRLDTITGKVEVLYPAVC